jgi:hypothetical protein
VKIPRLWNIAEMPSLDILRLAAIHGTIFELVCYHSNVDPGCRMPVGVVVTFLRTLISPTLTIVILASILCGLTVKFAISCKESTISFSVLAIHVIIIGFVHAISHVIIAVEILAVRRLVRNRSCGDTIPEKLAAHVLYDKVAIVPLISTAMLFCPLERYFFSFVVV